MANHYQEFSTNVILDSAEEVTALFEIFNEFRDPDYQADDDDDYYRADFNMEDHSEDGHFIIWISHLDDGHGNPDHVAEVMQRFIKKHKPDFIFTMTWCYYCSRPRVAEQGGGAIVVTKTSKNWIDTGAWAQKQVDRITKRRQNKEKK